MRKLIWVLLTITGAIVVALTALYLFHPKGPATEGIKKYVLRQKAKSFSTKYVKDLTSPVHIVLKPSSDNGRGGPQVIWEVTSQQVNDIVSSLDNYIKSRALTEERSLLALNHYGLQFGGASKNGKPYIHINAFCQISYPIETLERGWVWVMDGGICYFDVRYDPANRKFSCLNINAVAGFHMPYADPNCELEKDTAPKDEKAKP